MKKLLLPLLLLYFFISCTKTEKDPIPVKVDPPINFIKYVYPTDLKEIKIRGYTIVDLKLSYNITDNELSQKGFQIWQIAQNKNSSNGTIINTEYLSKRSDTIEVKLELSMNPGDTTWLNTELLSMRTDKSGSVIAKAELIPIIGIK